MVNRQPIQFSLTDGAPGRWAMLFRKHLDAGTRPTKSLLAPGKYRKDQEKKNGDRWTNAEFGRVCKVTGVAVGTWYGGAHPSVSIDIILDIFFGGDADHAAAKSEMKEAYEQDFTKKERKKISVIKEKIDVFTENHTSNYNLKSNIRVRTPRYLYGREDIIAKIETAMSRSGQGPTITALHGLRGVGKTMIAADYANRHHRTFRATWWIRAQIEELLRIDLIGLGLLLGWVQTGHREDDALLTIQDRICIDGNGILLVFDNAMDSRTLMPYLPRSGNAKVLITSNSGAWRAIGEPIEITVWSEEVGADFLIMRSGATEEERGDALKLSAALEGLPLAHEQAGALCDDRSDISLADYHRMFETAPVQLLDSEEYSSVEYGMTVAKTFTVGIEEAAKTYPLARMLIHCAAMLAPESIPLFLIFASRELFVNPDGTIVSQQDIENILTKLNALALLSRERPVPSLGSDTRSIRLHRLVRLVAAAAVKKSERLLILKILITKIADRFVSEPRDARLRLYVPHVLELLGQLHAEDAEYVKEAVDVDQIYKLVILALRFTASSQNKKYLVPQYLLNIIAMFYEVAPMYWALEVLMEEHKQSWQTIQDQLLKSNNYVLRYVLAEVVTKSFEQDTSRFSLDRILQFIDLNSSVNEFEFGGYIFSRLFATGFLPVDWEILRQISQRRIFHANLIVGQLILNLAFNSVTQPIPDLAVLLESNGISEPIWACVRLDIWAIQAAEAFVLDRPFDDGISQEAEADLAEFREIEKDIADLVAKRSIGKSTRDLLGRYWSLGQKPEIIQSVGDELKRAVSSTIRIVMRILFAHPIWSVREVAAAVMAALVAEKRELTGIINGLCEDQSWRVQFGAGEAAFQVRDTIGEEQFFEKVELYYEHPNCMVRALYVENLVSIIITSSRKKHHDLLMRFQLQFQYWLEFEEDCWVFEHLYRLFNTCYRNGIDLGWLLPERVSGIVGFSSSWYKVEREEFLIGLEQRRLSKRLDGRDTQ